MYSNSSHDITGNSQAAEKDEASVRSMYERAPYPGLGAGLKDPDVTIRPVEDDLTSRGRVRFLDAGCGTGHYLVGVAKKYPEWECHGIDLSQASLDIAQALAERHGVSISLTRGSYLDPLPFEHKFDFIAAIGTIHHAADPVRALENLRDHLTDDGFIFVHLYGLRLDREKFDIKAILDVFEPDVIQVERRFQFYDGLMKHRRRRWLQQLLQMPLIDILVAGKRWMRNVARRSRGIVWSPPFTARYDEPTAPWIDHFCHPCERAFEVPEVLDIVERAGLSIHRMLGQGQEYPQLIPPEWRPEYDSLPPEAKWRLSELLAFRGASFRMILKKKPLPETGAEAPVAESRDRRSGG